MYIHTNWTRSYVNIFHAEYVSLGLHKNACSTQLSMKFILHINVKMSTIVGILTFISIINTTSEKLKGRIVY